MTISKTPRADMKRLVDPHALALLRGNVALDDAGGLRIDAPTVTWDFSARDELHMPPPPEAWPRKKAPPIDWEEFNAMHYNEFNRADWIDWPAVGIGLSVAIVLGVFIAGASLLLAGAVFGFDLVDMALDVKGLFR